ncbi:MAG: hypothetical protein K1X56_07170 [Flavobacteriales bacterium]|nr:hypothetical protein [Flavobacteriales bacterium]
MNKKTGVLLNSIFIWLFFQIAADVNAQVDSTNQKAVSLAKQELTYYWHGRFCPNLKNTLFIYGFKIECVGCELNNRIRRNNRRVIKKINRVYGENWFEQNKGNFYFS